MAKKDQWFNKKEISAGEKRLKLTWWIYNHFGVFPIRVIAFFITLGSLLMNRDILNSSKKYFQYLYEYTQNKSYKPSFINSFKLTYNYSNSLIDKMLAYSDNYSELRFSDEETKKLILEKIENKQGAFFITNHIGNINILRSFITSSQIPTLKINVFLQAKQCEIFNKFINSISKQEDIIELHPVEEIDINTSIEIKTKLEQGEFVFMAGDRLSASATENCYNASLIGHPICLPLGVLKFAIMMDCPIFTTTCAKENKHYTMFAQELQLSGTKEKKLETLKIEYSKDLEKYTLKFPYQFYHFYNIFED